MDKIYLKRLLIYFYIFHHCTFSIALQKFNPKPSESTCAVLEAIFRSGYVRKCDGEHFDLIKECNGYNIDECFCSAINQTAREICKLQIISDFKKFNFDDELTKLQKRIPANQFCNYTMKLISNETYQERFESNESFSIIVQLNDILRTKCSAVCFTYDNKVQWLCSALVTVDALFIENLYRMKSTSLTSSNRAPKINVTLPANGPAETSQQSNLETVPAKTKNEDKERITTDHRLDTASQLPISKPANSSDTQSVHQKIDKQTKGLPSEDIGADTNRATPTKVKSGSTDLPGRPESDPNTVVHTKPKIVPPISLTASTASTTEFLQPAIPPESGPEHEDDFDGVSNLDLERSDDGDNRLEKPILNDAEKAVPSIVKEDEIIRPNLPIRDQIMDVQEESHLFVYFMALSLISIIAYIGFHNKHKIFAIVLEGKPSRGGRSRRRPNTAGYRKLDCNLEEAVTSQCNSNVTHVIY